MKPFIFITLLLIVIKIVHGESNCAKPGSSLSPSLQIKNKILCNYDKDYRPIKDQKKPINVSLRLVVKYVDPLSDEDGSMEVQSWLGVVWKDEFLTWNPSDYSSVKNIHVTSDQIWTPDLREEAKPKSTSMFSDAAASCLVSNDGFISCVLENEHDAQCETEVHNWPYDKRICEMVYTTGIYNISQLKINKNRIVLRALQPNPEWQLLNSSTSVVVKLNGNSNIKYNFILKRHSTRTTSAILIPALSLITMTLIPLWMNPTNVERFCLIATNMLSHFLFIQHMAYLAPTHEHTLPAAVTFFRDSLALAVAVMVELTLVKSLLNNKTASPSWLLTPCKFVASGVIGKTMLMNDLQETKEEETVENQEPKQRNIQEEKILIVTVFDRLLFFVLFITYFVLALFLIPFN